MFGGNPATLARMHDATFMPELADRKLREQWVLEGASTIHQRALNKALNILSQPNSAALNLDIDTRIRAEFSGLVAGNSILPEGWVHFEDGTSGEKRTRRVNRRRRA